MGFSADARIIFGYVSGLEGRPEERCYDDDWEWEKDYCERKDCVRPSSDSAEIERTLLGRYYERSLKLIKDSGIDCGYYGYLADSSVVGMYITVKEAKVWAFDWEAVRIKVPMKVDFKWIEQLTDFFEVMEFPLPKEGFGFYLLPSYG